MKIFFLSKTTRDGDNNRYWIFSSQEKVDAFVKKFELEDNEEEVYESYPKELDPERL